MLDFAKTLKALRIKKSVTQKKFAQVFHISAGTIGNWESGTREPNFHTLCTLADYFGVTTDFLLGRAPLQNVRKEEKTVTKHQTPRLEECLLAFVERVSKGDTTTETEVQVLPAVAQVLVNLQDKQKNQFVPEHGEEKCSDKSFGCSN